MKNVTRIILSTIVFLTLTNIFVSAQTESNVALQRKIDTYLSDGVSNGFSGSILIMKDQEIILNKAYGMANKENKIPYSTKTVSTIGSVTKQFTATAILKLAELEKLNVTDPLNTYFKHLPNDKKNITIHQLLTHSSGFIDRIGDGDFDDIPTKKFFKSLFKSKLLHQPGAAYSYSNAAYSILARIIELCSGKDYERFLHENLFAPAEMTQTGYFIPHWEENLIAQGYAYGLTNMGSMIQKYQEMGQVTWNIKGNGGIHSTPVDMAKWYRALKSNSIISKSSFEKLTQKHIKEKENETSFYGYGWTIYNSDRSTKIISHNGGNSLFFHDFIWEIEEDLLIILFTNAGSREVEVAWKVEKMVFDSTYILNPIKKNLHVFVIDYMKSHKINEAALLTTEITQMYPHTLSHPSVLNRLGYDLLRYNSSDNMEWALKIFKLNVELFPTDGNIWDSLGEGYAQIGQTALAIESYQKALDLASPTDCNWCKSSKKALQRLRQ